MANEPAAPPDIGAILAEIRDALKQRAADPQPVPTPTPVVPVVPPAPVPVPAVPVVNVLPDLPQSYFTALTKVAVIIAALTGLVTTIGTVVNSLKLSWNHAENTQNINEVKAESAANGAKLDHVKEKAAELTNDTKLLTDKVRGIDKKTDNVGKAVGAKPMGDEETDDAPTTKRKK